MCDDKNNPGGNKWISDDVEWIGPDKYKNYERLRESSKPNTQLGSSTATSAGSSKDKGKSKQCCFLTIFNRGSYGYKRAG